MEGSEFLDKKYSDLTGSKPVERAVQNLKRKGEKAPNQRDERIEVYLQRILDIAETKRSDGRTGFDLLKHKILEKYVTKEEDIPESYWKLQEKIMRERGQGGDWANVSEEQKEKLKKQNSEGVLADQKSSLEQWVDYFGSNDSKYIPKELKYWIFRSVLGLQEFDKDKKEFPKRSKGTIKQFPDINYEALGYVVGAVVKKLGGGKMEFEHDIQENERQEFLKFLEKEDFAKLYAWANELMNPIPEHLLPVTEGEWRNYEQGSDYKELVKTIRGKGTGWCTAGENTAKIQLGGGDFYIYYSLDDNKQPTIPRIAIRMEGDKIAEVRGVAYKQNLDSFMSDILKDKLEEFPDKDEYLQKEADMKFLTEIDNKVKKGENLNKEELIFLYEIDNPIQGFGYQKDPRIQELRKKRNIGEDQAIIFKCKKEQIAYNINEINKFTKAYIGEWNPEIMKKLPENIAYLYESFPERKILRRTIELTTKTSKEYTQELLSQGHKIYKYAQDMLNKIEPLKQKEKIDIVSFSVEQLGFTNGATLQEIYNKAKEFGLELCPPQVGPELRLSYKDQPDGEYLRIAMEPISGRGGGPRLFCVRRRGSESWLRYDYGRLDGHWGGGRRFVFRFRK